VIKDADNNSLTTGAKQRKILLLAMIIVLGAYSSNGMLRAIAAFHYCKREYSRIPMVNDAQVTFAQTPSTVTAPPSILSFLSQKSESPSSY